MKVQKVYCTMTSEFLSPGTSFRRDQGQGHGGCWILVVKSLNWKVRETFTLWACFLRFQLSIKTEQSLPGKELEITSTKNLTVTCEITPSKSQSGTWPEDCQIPCVRDLKCPVTVSEKNASPDQRRGQFVSPWGLPQLRGYGTCFEKQCHRRKVWWHRAWRGLLSGVVT